MTHHEILFPENVKISVKGKAVTIKPVLLSDFERFGKASTAAISMAASQSTLEIYQNAKKAGIIGVILGSCTSMSRWGISRLPAAVAVELMFEVIRVNKDFFEQALVSAATVLAGAELSSN